MSNRSIDNLSDITISVKLESSQNNAAWVATGLGMAGQGADPILAIESLLLAMKAHVFISDKGDNVKHHMSYADLLMWNKRLSAMIGLSDNYDDHGSKAPSGDSIHTAADILSWAYINEIPVFDIDADVLGGVAVFLGDSTGKYAWIACGNSYSSIVLINGSEVASTGLNDETLAGLLNELKKRK